MPLSCRSWRNLKGLHVSCDRFAEPVETSVYFFEHCRFDSVDLAIPEQDGNSIHVVGSIAGDIDGLGIDRLEFGQWLEFGGDSVNLHAPAPTTAAGAETRLADFLDDRGLVPQEGGPSPSIFRFGP